MSPISHKCWGQPPRRGEALERHALGLCSPARDSLALWCESACMAAAAGRGYRAVLLASNRHRESHATCTCAFFCILSSTGRRHGRRRRGGAASIPRRKAPKIEPRAPTGPRSMMQSRDRYRGCLALHLPFSPLTRSRAPPPRSHANPPCHPVLLSPHLLAHARQGPRST